MLAEGYWTLTLRSELSVQYRTHRYKKKTAADVGMLSSGYETSNNLHR